MDIRETTGKDGTIEYDVTLVERTLEDLRKLQKYDRVDERPFEAVAALSELTERAYELLGRPIVRQMTPDWLAKTMRAWHPLRVQRWAISDHHPLFAAMAPLAAWVQANRRPRGNDNAFVPMESFWSETIVASLALYRDLRDAANEAMFFHVYGNLLSLNVADQQRAIRRATRFDPRSVPAVKQVLVKVLASPFRSIGRMFTGSDDKVEEVKVDPVVFAAGSSVIGPAMEGHLNRVAQFLRDTPAVSLSLSPVVTAKDFDRLRGQEVTARIQKMQRERGIADYPTAVNIYYLAQNIPGEVPKTAEEQLKVLQEREQLPEERVKELLDRRVAATREQLVKTENVVPERLLPGEAHVAAADAGDGRIDFAITAE
jgi:hypothetical protein